jgi:hypothetical protein
LQNVVDPVFQLGFASLQVPDNAAVVYFTSHVDHDVRSKIQGKNPVVLPFWSDIDHKKRMGNLHVLGDAHLWWQHKVSCYLIGTSLHIWGVLDRALLHGRYERPYYTAGDVADDFIKRKPSDMPRYGTTVLHIFLGKPTRDCETHKDMLLKSISQCCQISGRLVITEANRDSGAFGLGKEPCLPSLADFKEMVSSRLREHGFAIKLEDYACGDSRFGGDQSKGIVARRNVLLIAEKA